MMGRGPVEVQRSGRVWRSGRRVGEFGEFGDEGRRWEWRKTESVLVFGLGSLIWILF